MTPFDLSVRFFLQLACILLVCRFVSILARRIGQPPVIGEMIAGVLLGPSLFGLIAPDWQAWLFPAESRPILFAGAQVGLTLYMFCVGLEFRLDVVRSCWRSAMAISISGIVAPFACGCIVAFVLLGTGGYFMPGIPAGTALPYLGAAMAITAFPVLARIITEQKIGHTRVGVLALAAGAIGDAAAWCVLAVVLAGMAGHAVQALWAIGGGVGFVVLLRLARPMFLGLEARWQRGGDEERRGILATVLALLMLAAWFTDTIKLYAVFGAFFLGVFLPRGRFVEHLRFTIEPLTVRLLLPLYFIYSGLNTRFDLLTNGTLWLVTVGVLIAAVVGKAGAGYLAARACGEDQRTAWGIGMLMNARGLMELIILNIGLERGVITPALFTIMVLMAVTTTLMATPLFNLVPPPVSAVAAPARALEPTT